MGELSTGLPDDVLRDVGIPDFRLYALAEGIRQFLYSQTQGLTKLLKLQNLLPIQPALFDP